MIYGTVTNGNTSATAGVQKDNTVLYPAFCNGSGGAATGGQSLHPDTLRNALTNAIADSHRHHVGTPDSPRQQLPSATPTATATATATLTTTATAILTPTATPSYA